MAAVWSTVPLIINIQDGCSMEYVLAVEATGMNLNFLIIILVILAIILTAVVVLAMYRSVALNHHSYSRCCTSHVQVSRLFIILIVVVVLAMYRSVG